MQAGRAGDLVLAAGECQVSALLQQKEFIKQDRAEPLRGECRRFTQNNTAGACAVDREGQQSDAGYK